MTEKKIKTNDLFVNFLEFNPENYQGLFLILHGWGSRSESWQKIGEMLAKAGYRVIIPDLPGFGKSDKPTFAWDIDDYCKFIEQFVNSLNLKKFYLLGHSFGGAIAINCSLKFPEKINKLYLVAPSCLRKKSIKKKFFYFLAKILKIFSFFPGYSLFRKGFYKFIVGKSDYPYTEGIMRDIYLKIIKKDFSDILPSIKIATLIIWGDKDSLVPLRNAYLIKEKIPNSHLVVIPQGDHDLERKVPQKLGQAIINNL